MTEPKEESGPSAEASGNSAFLYKYTLNESAPPSKTRPVTFKDEPHYHKLRDAIKGNFATIIVNRNGRGNCLLITSGIVIAASVLLVTAIVLFFTVGNTPPAIHTPLHFQSPPVSVLN